MNEPSVFQAQYPLSPRKFWKKVIAKLGFWLVLLVLIIVAWLLLSFTPDFSDVANFFLILFGALCAPILLALIFYPIYVKAYIKRYYYDCGEQFITIKKGVFAPTEIHVQYQKIQDVYVDQDILDRMMGLYDVHIASATITSGIEAHIDGVNFDVAEGLKNIILGKINNTNNSSTPAQTAQTSAPQQSQPQVNPVSFNQKISSETYPINSKWVWSALFSSFFISIFFSLIFSGMVLEIGAIYLPILFGVIFLINMILKSIWKSNFYFEFLPDYILLRTGVISRSENHLPYKSIQNVLNQQGIVDRMIGLSTVTIQNAAQQMVSAKGQPVGQGSAIALVWQPREKAEELTKILNEIVSKINPQNLSNMMGL